MILIWTNTQMWGGVAMLGTRFAEYLRGRGIRFAIVEPEGSRMRRDIPWADFMTAAEAPGRSADVTHLFMASAA